MSTVKAVIRDSTRDEAIILMAESNLQRSTILPSEKAFSEMPLNRTVSSEEVITDMTYGERTHKFHEIESSGSIEH